MTGRKLSRRTWLGLGALSVGAFGLGRWLQGSMPLGEDISDGMDVGEMAEPSGFPTEGPDEAAVTMLVFSDYACGVCRQVEPWWREAVRAAGDVRVIHRDWPILGPPSLRAARVALAADVQRLYLPVHKALMHSPGLGERTLRASVEEAGADWERLERDLAANAAAIAGKLARTAQDAMRLGYPGTPGFLIGPIRISGGASESQFADAIARARA